MNTSMRMRVETPSAPTGIPLELVPLLSPYGRDRRLSLRVEHMPSRARLSRGRNNGDHSWSLTRDELDGLLYLPPKGMTESHMLSIRIVSLDSDDGATLAVLEVPIIAESDTDIESDVAISGDSVSAAQSSELRRLRAELTETKSSLRKSESELAKTQREVERARAEGSGQKIDAELESARLSWKAELDERLAEAAMDAANTLEKNRASWQAETNSRVARAEERLGERIEKASRIWKREAEVELSKAEDAWKAGESTRLAAAQAAWQEQSERALAKETARLKRAESDLATARAEAARGSPDAAQLRRLRDEVTTLQSSLSDRDTKLAEVEAAQKLLLDRARKESDAALAAGESNWKSREATRLAEARAQWQEQSTQTLAKATARLEKVEAALAEARAEAKATRERRDSSETRRLRSELEEARGALAERETRLTEAQSSASRDIERLQRQNELALSKAEAERKAAEAERETRSAEAQSSASRAIERARRESELALSKAEAEWKAAEAERFDAAQAKWQDQLAEALSEVTGRLQKSEAALSDLRTQAKAATERRETAELRRLRADVTAAQATLAARDAEMAELQLAGEEVSERVREETQAALLEAENAWKMGEASRLAVNEAKLKEKFARELATSAARADRAEADLSALRTEAKTSRDRNDTTEIRQLRTEFATTRAALAEREAQLAESQLAASRARELARTEAEAALSKAQEAWKASQAIRLAELETRERERSAVAMAEAMARLKRTEAALGEARTQIETMRDPANDAELGRVRGELAAMQNSQSERDAELAQARAEVRKARDRWTEQSRAQLQRAEQAWRVEEAERLEAARREWVRDARLEGTADESSQAPADSLPSPSIRRWALGGTLVAAFAVSIVLLISYPRLFTPQTSGPAIESAGGAATPRPPLPNPLPTTEAVAEVNVSSAKLRSAPSSTSDVVIKLPRGTKLSVLERRGSWAHVRTAAESGASTRDGWIFSSFLKFASSSSAVKH